MKILLSEPSFAARGFIESMSKYTLIFLFVIALSGTALAQQDESAWAPKRVPWIQMTGSFLEPNRFAVIRDISRERLRLEAGFGGEIINIDNTSAGAEGLIWSGLKTLSNFRFPVETADYFFGIYTVYSLHINGRATPIPLRLRLSHISSHLVDGTNDTVIGGSSSRYSREFVSLESQLVPYNAEESWFALSVGVKYIFHQVTSIEPSLQFPITLDLIPRFLPSMTYPFLTLSTAGSAYFPQYSAALTVRFNTGLNAYLDIYGEYHSGATRYGVEGKQKEHGYEFGIKLLQIPFNSIAQ